MSSRARANPTLKISALRLFAAFLFALAPLSGASAQGAGAGNFSLEFPPNDPLRLITEPIMVGMKGFDARLAAARAKGREPLGLVLTGGSARAFAHIGVLEEMEKAGIVPDFIVADSMGAVVGMLYAAGLSPVDIADLVVQVPPETYLSVVLPTHGGFINTDAFVAAVKMMVGNIDLSKTTIPIIVIGEDLKTRRQVEFASGDFSKIMAMTFAMPAIFEPVSLDGFLLVDGGSTNVIPVGIAERYTKKIIVSTTLYDRNTAFGNPLNVINRAFDIGKTRTGLMELEKSGAFIIRNNVENISYMQFDGPEAIIKSGEDSARAALPSIEAGLGLGKPGTDVGGEEASGFSPELIAARHQVSARYKSAKRLLRDGVLPSVQASLRYKIKLKLAPNFEEEPLGMDSLKYIGGGLVAAQGRARETFSALYMLGNGAGTAWAATAGAIINPVDTLTLALDAGVFGEYSKPTSFPIVPSRISGEFSVKWARRIGAFRVFPKGMFTVDVPMDFSDLSWQADLGGTISLSLKRLKDPFSPPVDSVGGWGSLRMAGFVDYKSGATRMGPEIDFRAGLRKAGIGAIHLRAAGRLDVSGQGLEVENSDDFRGATPGGMSTFVSVINSEIVWHARVLEFDAGESITVKNIEIGPYFDSLWGGGTASGTSVPGSCPSAISGGITMSFTTSLIGLAPFDASIFCGIGYGWEPVLGLRVGRLFPNE